MDPDAEALKRNKLFTDGKTMGSDNYMDKGVASGFDIINERWKRSWAV